MGAPTEKPSTDETATAKAAVKMAAIEKAAGDKAADEKVAAEKAAPEKTDAVKNIIQKVAPEALSEKAEAFISKDTVGEDSVKDQNSTISKEQSGAQNQNLALGTNEAEQKLDVSNSLKKSQGVQEASKQGEIENSSKDNITSLTLQRENE